MLTLDVSVAHLPNVILDRASSNTSQEVVLHIEAVLACFKIVEIFLRQLVYFREDSFVLPLGVFSFVIYASFSLCLAFL